MTDSLVAVIAGVSGVIAGVASMLTWNRGEKADLEQRLAKAEGQIDVLIKEKGEAQERLINALLRLAELTRSEA